MASELAAVVDEWIRTDRYTFQADDEGVAGVVEAVTGQLRRREWTQQAKRDVDQVLLVVKPVRMLVREERWVIHFVNEGCIGALAEIFGAYARKHYHDNCSAKDVQALVQCAAVMKRTAAVPSAIGALVLASVPATLIYLLRTTEASVLPSVLVALLSLTENASAMPVIATLDAVDTLVMIVETYAPAMKILAVQVLCALSKKGELRMEMLECGIVRKALALLVQPDGSNDLITSLVRLLGSVTADETGVVEVRMAGAFRILLALLTGETAKDGRIACSVASLIAKLAIDDESAYQIRQSNGVYLLAKLLVLESGGGGCDGQAVEHNFEEELSVRLHDSSRTSKEVGMFSNQRDVRAYVLRALRFLFSIERNRKIFKRIFPLELFVAFIDVGHYVADIGKYHHLAEAIEGMSQVALQEMTHAIEEANIEKEEDIRTVRGYILSEMIGRGAYGSVFQARRERGETLFAVKEISLDAICSGESESSISQSAGEMSDEVQILRKISHPNIVRYYDSFREHGTLYIVMELVDGVSLGAYIMSQAEKRMHIDSTIVWRIFVQLCLALNFLHSKMGVVHRDLTPANIILSHNHRRVKIADFGLAKEVSGRSGMVKSMVGTMGYSCPEIIQEEEYTTKADVWSLGCVLYHMMALHPPFKGDNPFSLATLIVEGVYAPVDPKGRYDESLRNLVGDLLVTDPSQRPAIKDIAALISERIMSELDRLQVVEDELLQQLSGERERRQRDVSLACRHQEAYRKLLMTRGSTTDAKLLHTRNGSGSEDELSAEALQSNLATALRSPRRPNRMAGNAAPRISISHTKVRQIADPSAQILGQLHKLLFLHHDSPGLERDSQHRAVDTYCRYLFSSQHNGGSIKYEMVKLMGGSPDLVPVEFSLRPVSQPSSSAIQFMPNRITYEDLEAVTEAMLQERGYYQGGTS